jgi:hypothetical protein
MSFLMTKVGLNVFFSINQSVSHHNIMVLLPYVSQLSNVTSQVSVYRIREESIYGVHNMKNIIVIIGIFYSGS